MTTNDHQPKLYATLIETLREKQTLPFIDFMQMALYSPGLGYYAGGEEKLGPGGDFITAPLLGDLFAQCLVNQALPVFNELDKPCVLEFGPGTGQLALSMLLAFEARGCLPEHYYLLEISADLKARQKALLRQSVPHLMERITWLDALPETPISGVVIANEVFDAMPVERFMLQKDGVYSLAVGLNDQGQLCDTQVLASDTLSKAVNALGELPIGYVSEINPWLSPWFASLSKAVEKGLFLAIDYGFAQNVYYHPDRNQGTIMCHYQHRAHANPYANIGRQDITAHVDFTALAESAYQHGFEVAGFTDQAHFLLGNDLLSFAEKSIENEKQRLKRNNEIKTLTLPSEMGALFKVMGLTKNLALDLAGFQLQDHRYKL